MSTDAYRQPTARDGNRGDVQDAFVNLNGLHLHWYEAGESGSPVILLHGGGVDSAWLSWKLTLPALAEAHRTIAPEMPGYGRSDRPADFPHAVDAYVEVMRQLMDALDIERASLCGVSLGGAIAIGVALAHPQRVNKLVPVASYGLQRTAPAHFWSYLFVRLPGVIHATYALLRRNRRWARATLRSIFADPNAITDDLAEDVFAEIRRPDAGAAFEQFQKHEVLPRRMRTIYMDRLGEIVAPTLFVHGERDRLVPVACAREAQQRAPNAQLHVMHNCGHWPQRERPEEFNAVITRFLYD
ncbi:MAG: alpha/beta fold hydrolase [Anaerolineae bacterium]|nr:alpha/beta fold hydrolase [Anaerolineae bacterium]